MSSAISHTEPLYVCVHVPEFVVQALTRLRPELSSRPVAVLSGDPPLEQVCSANPRALGLGITHGMTRAELDSFPGVVILRRSEAEQAAARGVLLETAAAFTPRFEVQAFQTSAFNIVLDMAGTTLIFGPAAIAVKRLLQALTALRFSVRIAASANFLTAVCVAPSAYKAPVIVPAQRATEHLQHLPVAAISPTPEQAEMLALWGLRTLGELAALPQVEITVRMGQAGRRLWLLARGEHPHLMVPEEPTFTLEEFLAFDAPVELMDSLLFVLGPMLDQLLARAANRALALASVTVTLGLDGGGEHRRTVKPALPVLEREVLLKLLHLDLQAHPPPAGVVSICTRAQPGDRSKVQLGLFVPQLPEPLRLDVTLARIAAIVGEGRAGRARLRDTHRPDSFTIEPFVVPASASRGDEACGDRVALRRCRPPVRLSVRHDGSRLAEFFLQGKRFTVQEAYGPWRGSGDWWSHDEVWSQEQWDVRAVACGSPAPEQTLLCLIAHDLLSRQWRLEAFYD